MSKKHYTISNSEMTICANFANLSDKEKMEVKEYVELGYKFIQKEPKARNSQARKRSYFEDKLYAEDYEIFQTLASKKVLNKKRDGYVIAKNAYSRAMGFGSTIIKLGKALDNDLISEESIDEYRNRIKRDYAKGQVFGNNLLASIA